MAIDFYYTNDQLFKNRLFCLTEGDFEKMQNILKEYNRRTGLVIDQYGKTRIDYDHVKLIVDLLEKDQISVNKGLFEIKDKFKNVNDSLVAIGD